MSCSSVDGRSAVLFVENREKTRFWEAIASVLQARGHPVHWLVQNPVFAPSIGFVHRLPFPVTRRRSEAPPPEIESFPLLQSDRGQRYFDAGEGHYGSYAAAIGDVLDAVGPQLVIGESTLFHELLTIGLCQTRGLSYVHPTATRYPGGRFCLFEGGSQLPLTTSGETFERGALLEIAGRIACGRQLPVYMAPKSKAQKATHRAKWALTRGRVWVGRMAGERYNTPSLTRKIELGSASRRARQQWNSLATSPKSGETSILYPLQLQPEANIDVWGQPFSSQPMTIVELLAAAPKDVTISVKANPKFKYEVSDELIELARRESRVHLLPLDTPMHLAQEQCIGAVTVSGTVGYEAVFGRGRCLSLRHPILDQHFPDHAAASPQGAVQRLLGHATAGVGSLEQGVRLLELLVAQSFPGLISDPFSTPNCLDHQNVALVASAIESLLSGDRTQKRSIRMVGDAA